MAGFVGRVAPLTTLLSGTSNEVSGSRDRDPGKLFCGAECPAPLIRFKIKVFIPLKMKIKDNP
jgi:hypothetical protein